VDDDNRRRSSLLKSQNIQYVPALDHLRGFAALLVLFYHGVFGIYHSLTTEPPVLAYTDEMLPTADFFLAAFVYEGHSGAALFMLLSGFILTIGTLGRFDQIGSHQLFALLAALCFSRYHYKIRVVGGFWSEQYPWNSLFIQLFFVILPLSILVSSVTYLFIKKPFLKLRGGYSQPTK
jgi:peptidoglycan/LPS O-acetylase OafA/YrhL